MSGIQCHNYLSIIHSFADSYRNSTYGTMRYFAMIDIVFLSHKKIKMHFWWFVGNKLVLLFPHFPRLLAASSLSAMRWFRRGEAPLGLPLWRLRATAPRGGKLTVALVNRPNGRLNWLRIEVCVFDAWSCPNRFAFN